MYRSGYKPEHVVSGVDYSPDATGHGRVMEFHVTVQNTGNVTLETVDGFTVTFPAASLVIGAVYRYPVKKLTWAGPTQFAAIISRASTDY